MATNRKNRRLALVTTAALTNAITVGFASTYSSNATESMKDGMLNPNVEEISWIGSILPLGAMVGGLLAGYLSDKIGRKGVMMFLSLPLVIGWLSIAYATSLTLVYTGRFITGICCGLICVVTPMYVVEVSTLEKRGNVGIGFQLFICMGIIASSSAGKFLPWEWVAIIGAICAVVSLLCMLFAPESPRWLVLNDKRSDGIWAVNLLYGSTDNASVNQLVSESLSAESKSSFRIQDVISPTFYKPALLSVGLMFFQQFSGSNAILYYTVSIFKQANTSIDSSLSNLFVALVMYFSTLLTTYTIDIFGRKKSLYISGILTCISLNVMSLYLYFSPRIPSLQHSYGWTPLVCLMVYIAGFSLGLGPVPWLMMSEMSSVRMRGIICGLGTALSWKFAFILTKTFLQIEEFIGACGAYWVYSGFCFLSCFFTFFLLPETKGKTLEEIENFFAGGRSQLRCSVADLPDNRFTDEES